MKNPNQPTRAQLTDPGFKTFLVAQNQVLTPGVELDADIASEQAWNSSRTLAAALGKKRTERFHGKVGKHAAGVVEHDPYGTYRAHEASIKGSDAPDGLTRIGFENEVLNATYTERDGFVDSVFTPDENAELDAEVKSIAPLSGDELSDLYEQKSEPRKAA